ncbi:MAG: ferrous iron transport protein A [Candidatus Omnitrophica bacterium]|nr:ferrous iron transport protein A [Candidatus Omnitrophota bacterium]
MKRLPLTQMKTGQKGKVVAINAGLDLQNRLLSQGIYVGREITKLSHFALRGPVTIKVGRTVMALGYGMAHKITVELE